MTDFEQPPFTVHEFVALAARTSSRVVELATNLVECRLHLRNALRLETDANRMSLDAEFRLNLKAAGELSNSLLRVIFLRKLGFSEPVSEVMKDPSRTNPNLADLFRRLSKAEKFLFRIRIEGQLATFELTDSITELTTEEPKTFECEHVLSGMNMECEQVLQALFASITEHPWA